MLRERSLLSTLSEENFKNESNFFNPSRKFTEIKFVTEPFVNTGLVKSPLGNESNQVVNPDATEQELSTALSDPNTQIFQQALMASTRTSQARSTLSEVQSRHNDIVAIERKIQELAQMFTELGVMVELQEVAIDNVGRQAENVKTTTEEGSKEVGRAVKLARAIRRKKWWCLLIILLIIAVIVIVVVVTQVVNKKSS